MTWHPLQFSDIQQLSVHRQLFAFAEANLDCAIDQCGRLCAHPDHATYAHGAVVMSMAFHSLELFLKAGILKREPNEKFAGRSGHDMNTLSRRFFNLHPGKRFEFYVPFRRELAEPAEEVTEQELIAMRAYVQEREREVPEDQRHRYPVDVDGQPWKGAIFSFEPNSFLVTLGELRDVYNRLWPVIDAS